MTFRPELIDESLKDYQCPDDLMGEGGIFKQLTKALVERCLSTELDHHLTEEKAEADASSPKNRRNGASKKVQLCIVHLVRNALSYVSYKDRRAVAADLKAIYSAATATDAEAALMDFAATWDARYPTIGRFPL
jgi:transposase-like protein